MPKRRGEVQVFSVSFLDVLSCALGGVLLLLMLNMDAGHKQAESYAKTVSDLDNRMSQAIDAMNKAEQARKRAEQSASDARQRAREEQEVREEYERAQAALIGLEGDMNNVVFIFDTSGSMKATGRFDEYKKLLTGWVEHLPKERFNVLQFHSDVIPCKPGSLMEVNDANRAKAAKFIAAFVPNGGTNTLEALQRAFGFADLDTIVLMTDGRPDQDMDDIHRWLSGANANGDVVINCVAMGDYGGKEYLEFLHKVARDHGGTFTGR